MNNRERTYRTHKNRRNNLFKRKIAIAATILVIVLIGTISFCNVLTSARGNLKEDQNAFKYYKSIEIKAGDTLWGIAQKYRTSEYTSIQEYIDEIKEINHLTSDNICESKYLMIAYYDTEFK